MKTLDLKASHLLFDLTEVPLSTTTVMINDNGDDDNNDDEQLFNLNNNINIK